MIVTYLLVFSLTLIFITILLDMELISEKSLLYVGTNTWNDLPSNIKIKVTANV